MNAVTLIKADHDRVALLYKRYLRMAGDAAEQRALVEQICHELEVHATLEEDIFYPALQAKLEHTGTDLVAEAMAEHNAVTLMIRLLRNGALADSDYDSTVRRLMQSVQHHVREEEGEMLPQAEQQLGSDLDQLGMQMQQRKEAVQAAMPTTAPSPQGAAAPRQSTTDGRGHGNGSSTQSPQQPPTDQYSDIEARGAETGAWRGTVEQPR